MALGILWKSPRKELCCPAFWRDAYAEVMSTMLLLFIAVTSNVKMTEDEEPQPLLLLAIANGLLIFVIIETLGHVSGTCINPTVAIMFVITKKLTPLQGFVYILAEMLGAIIGTSYGLAIVTDVAREAYQPMALNPNITVFQGIATEVWITHALVLVIQGTGDVEHRTLGVYMPTLVTGALVLVNLLSAIRLTGCSMNPIVSFGPSVVTGNFTGHWIYWVGPNIGMLLAVLEYNLIYCSFWPKKQLEIDTCVMEIDTISGTSNSFEITTCEKFRTNSQSSVRHQQDSDNSDNL